ncbi:DNA-3-methyladenine glycosylase I [Leisingera aquaemixtae]|uniref:DNA-3-methyladenine glycosylase I n=1 Tax=Leisingera TaxID=191028 RepID=UPI001C946B53|nr:MULTISPECIES: DNA-3-methyladenine glycosylase I [Leisingera]MBY6067042.1 DNA-3-methyladenine glycosylase I [Leisingera aquaemixtae]MCB4455128.1 DNA-3-methyladenine glycosylase I [Leisingera sp. McT4-56]
MRSFDEIYAISADRHGGPEALEENLTRPDPKVTELPEDRWLATMTKCIFQAGFNWKVIEAKWQGFEEVFHGFAPGPCAFMPEDEFDRILSDTRVVRNGAKLATVRANAAFLMELRDQGGAGKVLGGWPSTDYIGLLEMLKKRGSRLGGMTGQYAMRFAGRDSFILSQDVTARLIAEGVIDKPATSKSALKAVQGAFNTWMEQSGRSLTEISRVLAMSC